VKSICIIPARGGSKRIPRKNIKPFLGKPILAYSIELALQSKLFDTVMVSTEDAEIAEVAKSYGAEIPFIRSASNADDNASTFAVLEEVLSFYNDQNILFSEACCLYPCAPLIQLERFQKAHSKLANFDCVLPVLEFSFPIQRAFELSDSNEQIAFVYPEHITTRSQDLRPRYHDAGQFYWFKPEIVLAKSQLITNKTGAVIIPAIEGQDIDTYSDWQMAELKYRILHDIS